jgi:radical SAM modification target selenobiotic family peptide
MELKELKKILAGLCLAGLVSGSGLVFAASGSG